MKSFLHVLGICMILPIVAIGTLGAAELDTLQDLPEGQLEKGIPIITRVVNCDRGQSISRALERSFFRLEVAFQGTCKENVVIRRDDVTLKGTGELVGSIRIEGSDRVTIEGFTVRDNTDIESGIEAVAGSSVLIRDMVVLNSVNRGIRIRDSVAEITDVTVDQSGTVGILARGSQITLEGTVQVSNSVESNLVFTDASSVFSKDGQITTTNGEAGLVVQNNSAFEGVFGSLTANNNRFFGILVATRGVFVYGFDIEANGNGFAGLFLDESSSFSPFGNLSALATTTFSSNGVVGAISLRDSTLELRGAVSISGQQFGVFVEAGFFRMTDVSLSGNAADLSLNLGATADFIAQASGNSVAVVLCDGTNLTRGDVACP